MRITTGKFGGRKLLDNPYDHIRPTADVVKQSIFNRLMDITPNAVVLDLFCGTGALGIEAISRGAKEVVFADKDPRSVKLTQNNLKNLGISSKVMTADFNIALKSLKNKKFDLIILDPPYMSGVYEKALSLIDEYNLLADEGIIVCEHEKSVKIDFTPFEVEAEKRYGIKIVSYLRKKTNQIEVLNIRDNIEYLEQVMQMNYDQWGDFFTSSKEEKMKNIKKAFENQNPFPQIFALKKDNEIIGSFIFKEHDLGEEYASLSPWLACVIIRKDLRGKGYGKEILLQIDKIARELYPHLYLFTKHVGYYEKIGFEFVKEFVHHGEVNRLYKKEY